MTIMCLSVADYVIQKSNELSNFSIRMTCKRLMKLIYFCDIEFMKKNKGKSLITDDYYAWESGPVLPEVYLKYMRFQTGKMFPLGNEYHNLSDNICQIIEHVIEKTLNISTEKLIEISHIENGPWYKYKDKKTKIPKNEIYEFYKKIKVF